MLFYNNKEEFDLDDILWLSPTNVLIGIHPMNVTSSYNIGHTSSDVTWHANSCEAKDPILCLQISTIKNCLSYLYSAPSYPILRCDCFSFNIAADMKLCFVQNVFRV